MAHVLGFGTTWSERGLITDASTTDPIFNGAETVGLWPPFAATLGYSGRAVPLENNFGVGTRLAHWPEAVFHAELMTGFIENTGVPMPLSRLTIATFKDLGYSVDYSFADTFAGNLMSSLQTFGPPTRINETVIQPTFEVGNDRVLKRIPK
jgi:hypothetical protein